MKASSQWIRRAFLWSATGATTAAMIVAGSSAQAAHSIPNAGPANSYAGPSSGPGYPPPGGIYKPFTNCPLLKPLMQESLGGMATGCVAGDATSGSIKIGNITTAIKHPVNAQFGIWDPPNATPDQFTGGILPPPDGGLQAQLVTSPEFVPGGLLKALGCPNSDPTVQKLCRKAQRLGGKYLKVYASAQSAGQITNFALTTWTQPVKFQLINPLLGTTCYIGSNNNPVVLNPSLSGHLVIENDPHPRNHPDTGVLKIRSATAADTVFTAPGVTGCGPGGSANIAVDLAIDTSVGLPSASGSNSLTLNGTFYLADCFAPANMANILLSAFKASVGTKAVTTNRAAGHRITFASLRDGHYGFRLPH